MTASDFYAYHRPSQCDLRIYLRHHREAESPPGPYEEVMRRLGERHEKAHLATFSTFVDLSGGTRQERERRTQEEARRGSPVIYQAVLRKTTVLNGVQCEILGEPDFLIHDSGDYAIRDSKLSRRVTDEDHPEILRQVELYGWLYQQTFGKPPIRLEVHSGTGDIVVIPYDGGRKALATAGEILAIKQAQAEPYTPVGWTKCGDCGFCGRCWPQAAARRDVALVTGVDQGLAIALKREGVETVDEFLARYSETSLAQVQRPWGGGSQRVGKRAGPILRMARSIASGKEILIQNPDIPDHPNYVIFDIEGLPPHLDELEKVYLWGLQVFGERPSEFRAATAGFGGDGDREGWEQFLAHAKAILDEYGDLPFVHWHHYERVRLDMYMERFGDRAGVAALVRQNLLDLLPITQRSIALPLPSYSLKVVEQYIGFRRTQEEYGGEWSMAKYIEATETEDPQQRQQVMDQILAYNREDLEATWAVLKWLRAKQA